MVIIIMAYGPLHLIAASSQTTPGPMIKGEFISAVLCACDLDDCSNLVHKGGQYYHYG